MLAGDEGSHDAMLSSPVILYDYPQIAPESPQNLFDGTEIDEILTLRIMTLTDEEKAEIRRGDERTRAMLERTENMPAEQLMKLHGALRGLPRTSLRKGHRVRLRPQRSADIMDIALRGRIATIDAIEEDMEGNVHFAVVIDDDPGRDLGEMRQPGHRFFLRTGRGRANMSTAAGVKSILIAGIGNIFLGDDAFGVEVARRLGGSRMARRGARD